LIHNDTNDSKTVTLQIALPDGWSEKKGTALYPIPAHGVYPVAVVLIAPSPAESKWQQLSFDLESDGKAVGSALLRVHVRGLQ